MLALGGFGHQLDKARVYQHPGNRNRQRHIGFELHRRGGRDHQRQEEERAVADHRQNSQRWRAFGQHAGHLEDHCQQLNHRSADNRRDQRRHGADQRVEDPGADAFQSNGWFPLRFGGAQIPRQQRNHFTIRLGDGIAHDHLALVIATHDAEHAFQPFEGGAVDPLVVFDHETQAGHAVGDGGNVICAANCRDNLLRQSCIIFRHRILSCLSMGYWLVAAPESGAASCIHRKPVPQNHD